MRLSPQTFHPVDTNRPTEIPCTPSSGHAVQGIETYDEACELCSELGTAALYMQMKDQHSAGMLSDARGRSERWHMSRRMEANSRRGKASALLHSSFASWGISNNTNGCIEAATLRIQSRHTATVMNDTRPSSWFHSATFSSVRNSSKNSCKQLS